MSGCADVCLDMGYDEPNEFYAAKTCVARKEHQCCECGERIATGAKYERANGKSDGAFWSFSTCVKCVEIREAFVCGSFVFEQLWETIGEEMFPRWNERGPWECLAKLTTDGARSLINHKYREWRKYNEMDADDRTGGEND